MNIENYEITLVTADSKTMIKKQLNNDPEMLNWVAEQFADVNSAQVTIRNMSGKVVAFTGKEPV